MDQPSVDNYVDCDCHFRPHYHDHTGVMHFLPSDGSITSKQVYRIQNQRKEKRKRKKLGFEHVDYKWQRLNSTKYRGR